MIKTTNPFLKNWGLIVFIAGGLINAGVVWAGYNSTIDRVEKLERKEEARHQQDIDYAVLKTKTENIESMVKENKATLKTIEILLRDISSGD